MGEVPTESDARPGQVVAGRYRADSLVARGGMATVWAGHDTLLDRPVALKFPLGQLRTRPDFLARFRREAIAAARLNHPNVVAVYDTGEDAGLGAYIVMELVPGQSLRQRLVQEPTLPVDRAVDIATQVATALDFAHARGVVHRDVKPANVLLYDGRVKVADFGIAKAAFGDDGITKTDVTLGTARYISPEQVEGGVPDSRSDLYSLGVVLYEMVCGRTPFDADTDLAMAVKHLHEEVPLPSLANSDVPAWLDGVILTALAKDPGERYQSAAELRQALVGRGAVAVLPPRAVPAAPTPVEALAPVDLVEPVEPLEVAPADPTRAVGAPTRAVGAPTRTVGAPTRTPAGSGAADATGGVTAARGSARAVVDQTPPPAPPAGPAADPGDVEGYPAEAPAGKRAVPVVALMVAAVAVALAAAVFGGITASRGGNSGSHAGSTGSAAGPTLTIAGARSFDPPPGDGSEHDEQLGNLTDNNPSTYWETSHYDSAAFGGLKKGVGVVLQLSRPADVAQLNIDSPDSGWAYQVYVSNSSPDTLSGWGSPVASGTVRSRTTTAQIGGKSAGYLLLWITYLGDGNSSVRIGDLSVAS